MFRYTILVSIIATNVCLANPNTTTGAKTPPGLAAIVGTFDCVTHGSDGVVWHFHSVNHAWGSWVRADTTFAPQNGQPADTASTFVGFDAAAKRWNIISIDTDGSYYTRYSTSRAFDGSHWVDGYPADGAKAHIRAQGGRQYVFELISPGQDGHGQTSTTTCTRV